MHCFAVKLSRLIEAAEHVHILEMNGNNLRPVHSKCRSRKVRPEPPPEATVGCDMTKSAGPHLPVLPLKEREH
jgi:hypothetical protein